MVAVGVIFSQALSRKRLAEASCIGFQLTAFLFHFSDVSEQNPRIWGNSEL